MNHTITAYSTALFSTWINIEQLGLLFDAGDGVSAGLLQKSRKIKDVFITHPDRDHLGGLLQFNQLNSRKGFPRIHYPADSGSFPALEAFQAQFDPHVSGSKWIPVRDEQEVMINKSIIVRAIRNEHIEAAPGISKSLSYKLYESKRKLKSEFETISKNELISIIQEKGREFITEETRTNFLAFSGDTPVDDYGKWDNVQTLIHECTFLKGEKELAIVAKRNKHSYIDEVFKMASEINLDKLILTHFSSRYSREMIDQSIREMCKTFNIQIPVYAIYPGEIHRDVLGQSPIN